MKPYLDKIDTETAGPRNDVTPLFADRAGFAALVEDLAEPFVSAGIEQVACIDALGFVLGTAMAVRLEAGVVAIRKGGKLPVASEGREFTDYSGERKGLEIRIDLLEPGARVLIVDEWVETGAQVEAAISLVESQGAVVAGIAAIRMDRNERTGMIRRDYRVHTVWDGD